VFLFFWQIEIWLLFPTYMKSKVKIEIEYFWSIYYLFREITC